MDCMSVNAGNHKGASASVGVHHRPTWRSPGGTSLGASPVPGGEPVTTQGNTITDEKVIAVPLVFLWSNDTLHRQSPSSKMSATLAISRIAASTAANFFPAPPVESNSALPEPTCKPCIGSCSSAYTPSVSLNCPGTFPWPLHGIHCGRHLPKSFEGELRRQPRGQSWPKPKVVFST